MGAQWKVINQNYKNLEGYKRVAWPPASEERIVREFTPQPQTQYQPAPAYNQQYQPTAATNASTAPLTQQQYRAPSYDINQQPQQQQQQQYPPQAQNQAPLASQNYYQQPPQTGPYSQQQQQPPQQPAWVPQQAAPQQPQQQYQQPPWVQQQQQYQPQQQPAQYQNSLNQYQNQAPPHHHHQQQQQYPLQQNQFVPQTNQQQFNSYSQPQQQQHTVSHDQVDQQQQPHPIYPAHLTQDQRGASPGIITLRKEAPITQKPAPVYTSQPAAISFRESSTDSLGGSNMRGDLKWPPPEYKEAAVKENEERRKLALGPVCRPRKVNRDYSSFFAKNALSHHYPSYKVPPGTQHMIN